MSMITHFMGAVAEPQFILARDVLALAIADGEITQEEREAISHICHIEGVDEMTFMQTVQEGKEHFEVHMPQSRKEKEDYLRELILLIGADEYCSPQEAFLFQIIASKMGLSQMDVVGLFMLNSNHINFRGDVGSKVLASFLKNYIDPIGRTEKQNRQGVHRIYETIAASTDTQLSTEEYASTLKNHLARTTELLKENQILIRDFHHIGIDYLRLLKEEETSVFRQFMG